MRTVIRLALWGIALIPVLAAAQGFPNRALRIIVPFPPGGPSDLFARVLAQGMGERVGQPVVIENKAGAGGVVGIDFVSKAPPDGYTIGLNNGSSVAMAPFSMGKMPYDPKRDLAYITLVVKVPEVLVVNQSITAKSLDELIAFARANPGRINYGSAGAGSITHLAVELLKSEAKIDLVHVPYKGAAPAVADMIGGQVQMGVFDVPVVLPHIKSGAIRALAVTSNARTATLPEVPSTVELKYPGVNSDNWYGLVVPAATPADIQKRLHAVAVETLRSPQLAEQYSKVSGIAAPTTPDEYVAFVASEAAKWGTVIKAIGFKSNE